MPNESCPIVLETQSGVKVQLPVGIGLTPTFWKKQNNEIKKAIANHFKSTIGQFEEDILHVGHALAESELTATPCTQSDVAIAIALGEYEQMENSANDAYVAPCVATEETGLVLFYSCRSSIIQSLTRMKYTLTKHLYCIHLFSFQKLYHMSTSQRPLIRRAK